MGIERSRRRVASGRMVETARRLLDASVLCALATVSLGGRAHVSTAYFAWTPAWEVVWLSDPDARHSRNIRANRTLAVYDSRQSWGEPDCGVQLFGAARELREGGVAARRAADAYARRFAGFRETDLEAYAFYVFRPRRVRLFDERAFGTGTFVTARVAQAGRLEWERTDVYRPRNGEERPRSRPRASRFSVPTT